MLLYLNEYHVAQAVYTLHGDSKLWLDNISKAQVYCLTPSLSTFADKSLIAFN